MTTEVCAATVVAGVVKSATESATPVASMVESIAKVVSGISLIGEARNALQVAGWPATIAANRITVDDTVEAQLLPAKVGTYGAVEPCWIVSSVAGTRPAWIVGTEPPHSGRS